MAKLTFKSIVIGYIRRDSQEWLESIMKNHSVNFKWTETSSNVNLERSSAHYYYDCPCQIVLETGETVSVIVGGVIDDDNIYHSVVYAENKTDILWMKQEKSRIHLGIETFSLDSRNKDVA